MATEWQKKAAELVTQMTLEEKASLCSGKNFWETKAVERLGVQSFMVTDGPHGLRKQAGEADHLGLNASVEATCFPTAAATACSFDPELLRQMGEALGEECRADSVGVLLGPAANIKRSPLCGRNFEYFSEDPLLTGEMAAALIEGVQSRNVGTSMKHYLANNQEKARVSSNSVVDERALREIYLAGFERAVKKAQPWTLMCSYNQINGTYASDNKRLMTDVPRGEWGFEGAIMTDWGAMNDRVQAIRAGLDLEMPGTGGANDALIVQAVRQGRLSEAEVDACAVRMTALALRLAGNTAAPCDKDAHHELARRVARESAALEEEALRAAAGADVVVAMVGLPDSWESEGFDRAHMELPENQNALMEALIATGKPVVAVLSTGGAVTLPWRERVDSILLMYLAGQNGGNAVLDLLLGDADPCGRLAETWPLALTDTPCHGFFGGSGNVEYRESVYVGYRYYDKARREVAYPFGHGLSYTDFAYSGLTVRPAKTGSALPLEAELTVTNIGARAGHEVVQVYVAPPAEGTFRPVRELRAFAKVWLEPGESRTVRLALDQRAFAFYDAAAGGWRVDGGEYTVEAGASSRDIRLTAPVRLEGSAPEAAPAETLPSYCDPAASWPPSREQFEALLGAPVPPERPLRPFTSNSTLGQVRASLAGRIFYRTIRKNMEKQFSGTGDGMEEFGRIIDAMLEDMPLRQLAMLSGGAMSPRRAGRPCGDDERALPAGAAADAPLS